ncbi:6107_t:CDS:2 [Ambispora leptoticha]|uniref:6107_t:CDS:1 n=1 Tax=Ambispora leptoticha TaxID=144679 RepID=A0A9N9G4F5_9GLOM|nr:6107_t:CDS:2 [Ambispora leptoticha]
MARRWPVRLPDIYGPVRTRMTCKVVCRSKAGVGEGTIWKTDSILPTTFLGTINGSINGNITCGNFTGSSKTRLMIPRRKDFSREIARILTRGMPHSSVTESVEVLDDSESDTGSIDIDRSEEEIRKLTQVDIRNKLLKILTARQKKDKEAGKDFMASIYFNNIIDLSDDEIYKWVFSSTTANNIYATTIWAHQNPVTFGDFEQFSKDMICLIDWQTDVLSTVRAINKATTNFMENNNNICITSVNDTPQKKESNKNQPFPNPHLPIPRLPVLHLPVSLRRIAI